MKVKILSTELERIADELREHAGYGRTLEETAKFHNWANSLGHQAALLREALGLLREIVEASSPNKEN